MDLARTPNLPEQGSAPAAAHLLAADDHAGACVRLLTPHQSAAAQFATQWARLSNAACEPNPFFEPWFLQPSLSQFAQDDQCQLLCVFSGDDLIGLLPIERSGDYYGHPLPHLRTWLHPNAFCGAPMIAHGFELLFWETLLSWCDRHPARALFLHLPLMPANGPAHAALNTVLAQSERKSALVAASMRAMLASDLSPDAYLEQAMSTKKRKELRRQRKRLADLGELVVERPSGSDRLEAWIADYLALEAAGWKGAAGSALANANETNRFFASALTGAAHAGRLERLSLLLNSRPIAMLANFVTPPGAFSFKTTFDQEFARYSPGLLLQVENLELLARSDVQWADSCAVQGHSMIERIWREKRRIISSNIAIGGAARRLIFAGLSAYETRGQGHKTP